MGRLIGGLLDNDSPFGRIMTRCWVIIAANILFVLFSLPVITAGPALSGLYYCMFRALREDFSIQPVKVFWKGFKMNLKQGMAAGLLLIALAAFLSIDIRYCRYAGGVFTLFLYALYAISIASALLAVNLFPVISVFQDTFAHQLRNAFFFTAKKPLRSILLLLLYLVPGGILVLDERMRPLYVFLIASCAFGLIALAGAKLLRKDYEQYLPESEKTAAAEAETEKGTETGTGTGTKSGQKDQKLSERKILREMKKLDR